MAKNKDKRSHKLTKKQLSRSRREQRQLRWLWTGVGVTAVVVVAIIAVGLISQSTRQMATVNGETIKVTNYQKRVRYYYYALGPDAFQGSEGEQSSEIYQLVADQLIEEALIRQEAEKRGLLATEEELQIELEETWFQHYRNPSSPTPSPTVDPSATPTPEGTPPLPTATPDTPETFEANYETFVDNVLGPARVSESYFRQMVEVSVLRDKLEATIVTELPFEEDQVWLRYAGATDAEGAANMIAEFQAGIRQEVHARHILVATAEEAQAVLQRLENGDDFAALAAELSTDTSNKDDGGDLGWFPRGRMVPEFETVAFASDIGLYPEPVETQFGFHVIEILAREDRPVDTETEMFDIGWYGKAGLSEQFGPLFAEMVFSAELGLFSDPVPTTYGVAVIEILGHEVRPLEESERESRRAEAFQNWLDQVKEEGDIQNLWDATMIPVGI